jgi:archaemetzincin
VPEDLAGIAAGAIRSALGVPVGILAAGTPPAEAHDAARGQWSSRAFLLRLLQVAPPDARCVVGITDRDLFQPVLTFVFGEAQLGGRAAVVSFCRLREEFYLRPADHPLLLGRLCKEVLHEVGHALGLVHCAEKGGCVMRRSTSLGDTDAKPASFCFRCRSRIDSLDWSRPAR